MLLSPELLLADEPTGNLDSRAGSAVLGLIRDLNREEGHTVLMVTHDPSAAAVADRVVFLRDGQLAGEVEGGSTERVIDFYASLLPDHDEEEQPHRRRHGRRDRGVAMLRSLDRMALRQMRSRKLRSALTALGVVLGVGMVFGVLLLVGTIRNTFDELIDSAWGTSDFVVTAEAGEQIPSTALQDIRSTPGVRRPAR